MPEFRAETRYSGRTAIIDLHGDIDGRADAGLNAAYEQAAAADPSAVLLNFAGVGYINSTGIALIVGLLAQSRKAQRSVLVSGLSDHYLHIFQITRLADFMSFFPDEEAAIAGAAAATT